MKCETVADRIPQIAAGTLPDDEQRACMQHIAACDTCTMALKGATAMWTVRSLPEETAPEGLFERVMSSAAQADVGRASGRRFWLGAGFGGAIAASLLAVAFALGFLAVPNQPAVAEFHVSTTEARPMHVAIEADRALDSATISILLSGDVRIDGFGDRRELVWTDDLDEGINQLTLPLIAIGDEGGQMVVRLDHPDSEQLFVVQLRTEG
jgi:anti-sigma factor RsiW